MLTVSPSLYAAFEADTRARFVARSQAYLEDRFGGPVETQALQRLFDEARGYGLESEQELVRYALLALLADRSGIGDRAGWTSAVMAGRGPAFQRLQRLREALQAHLIAR